MVTQSVSLPFVTLGPSEFRYLILSSENGVEIISDLERVDMNKCRILFLARDALMGSKHLQKNFQRVHAKYTKSKMSLQLNLKDFRIKGLNNSKCVWFYTIHGFFEVISENQIAVIKMDFMIKFKDLWLDSVHKKQLPEVLEVSLHNSPEVQLNKEESDNNTMERKELEKLNDIQNISTDGLANLSDPIHDYLNEMDHSFVVSPQPKMKRKSLNCKQKQKSAEIDINAEATNRKRKASPSQIFINTSSTDSESAKTDLFVKSCLKKHLASKFPKEFRLETVINMTNCSSSELDSDSQGTCLKSIDTVTSSKYTQTDTCSFYFESNGEGTCSRSTDIVSSSKYTQTDGDYFRFQSFVKTKDQASQIETIPTVVLPTVCQNCHQTLIKDRLCSSLSESTRQNNKADNIKSQHTNALDRIEDYLHTKLQNNGINFSNASYICESTCTEELQTLTSSNTSSLLSITCMLKDITSMLESTKHHDANFDNDWEVSKNYLTVLNNISKWLGKQFHTFEDLIVKKAQKFKEDHISCIDNLPPASQTIEVIFPPPMLVLLKYWMGLESEYSLCENAQTSSDEEGWNSSVNFSLLQHVLEFANNTLVSGVAHVVYSRLKHFS